MPRRKRINLNSQMGVVKGPPADWDVPAIVHLSDLAAWLGLSENQLFWIAELGERSRNAHYVCRWIRKRHGIRLIESPKPILKTAQKQILRELIPEIPVSDCAHGFVKHRGVTSFVAKHVGQYACLKMDLRNFFPSIGAGRVFRFFSRLGYPKGVARVLTGICTTATRREILQELRNYSQSGQQTYLTYGQRHLPQGAPTSPALSNFCAYKLDCRLHGLAVSLDGNYSRYADDLLFSFNENLRTDVQRNNRLRRLSQKVAVIAFEEGFDVNFRKTRIMFASQRQHSAGIVFNEKPNLPRDKYDAIKATLFNSIRYGPDSQNHQKLPDFQAHLAGRIGWVRQINKQKAAKLDQLFRQIDWRSTDH